MDNLAPAKGISLNKKDLLSKSELSIWLDDYDDVFSDFDSRPINERSLSDDFLVEVRKMVREKPTGAIELKLLIPAAKRKKELEAMVVKNLHAYFKHAGEAIKNEMDKTRRRGFLLAGVGFLVMILTAYLVSISNRSFIFNAMQIILEPSGWFMVWSGMDNIFYNSRQRKPNLDFNSKMGHAEIIFVSY
jgi:hypothetical protein